LRDVPPDDDDVPVVVVWLPPPHAERMRRDIAIRTINL
jgi:hypothetical protein